MSGAPRRLAVVGAGWAGLAAAVRAVERGWQVTVFEMARHAGGRARSVSVPGAAEGTPPLDNGQHILIGAYARTLALMRTVGADPEALLHRGPLVLAYPDGHGLRLPAGGPLQALVRGVLGATGWSWRDKAGLLATSSAWALRGFRCDPGLSVAHLCGGLSARVCSDLIEPLCVAALNTPAGNASAQVFLRVLRDALFVGRGSADLLLPRVGLSELLPAPALAWLSKRGADLRVGRRVLRVARGEAGWLLDGERFDAAVLACSAAESARLAAAAAPAWSATAAALRQEPILTVWLRDRALRLPHPMLALRADDRAPAQFVFDLDALGRAEGLFAFVVSGARDWTTRGLPASADAVLAQARRAFPGSFTGESALCHVAAERRATFACTPGLQRPPLAIAPGLLAAGDHVRGPYPATLEGAVRSGEAAAAALA